MNQFLNQNKRIITLICTLIFISSSLVACSSKATVAELQANNDIVVNTSWVARDGSCMVFIDDTNYAWYQKKDVVDDNYFAGTYEFYMGNAALEHLTVDLKEFGVTKDEMQQIFDSNEEYSLENFVCMTVDNESFMLAGEEQLEQNKEISYYGFLLQDGNYLDIANMVTGTYYGFMKE